MIYHRIWWFTHLVTARSSPLTIALDLSLVTTLHGLNQKVGKNYCFPSQTKLLELLNRFTGQEMSRRTLNRHLRKLEDSGWLKRKRRIRWNKGIFEFNSTLYTLTRKAYRWIGSFSAGISRVTQKAHNILFNKKIIGRPPIHSGGPPRKRSTEEKQTALNGIQQLKEVLR